MSIDKKILKEIERHNRINRYINEQELPPLGGDEALPTPGGEELPPAGGITPPPGGDVPPPVGATTGDTENREPIDTETDPDVEKLDSEGKEKEGDESEELDITDLVTSQKNVEEKQEEYFQNLFSQLSNLESKLKEMDSVLTKLNDIETKIEKYRPKTPQEKLELRSLDSGPFNQKLTDFFTEKEEDIEKSGKNEYVLTTDDVQDYQPSEIKASFNVIDPDNLKVRSNMR
jgi:hypothetical protein